MLKPADLLQAALYFRLGEKYMLKTVIEKFPTLIVMDDKSGVKLQSETLREILEDASTPLDTIPVSRSNPILHESEVALVRRFHLKICDDELYSRFEFDNFFESKTGHKTARICLGAKQVIHVRLLRTCLDSLCTRQQDTFLEPLRHYAAMHFHRHLQEVDLLDVSRDILRAIGLRLMQLICDPATIDTWWRSSARQLKLGSHWSEKDENVELLRQCLSNPFVKSALAEPGDIYKIMTKVAGRIAALWFGNERSIGLRDEALRLLEKLELETPDNWTFLRFMGETHTDSHKGLRYLQRFREHEVRLLNSDPRYTLSYWDAYYVEGKTYSRLDDLQSATSCWETLVAYHVEEDEYLRTSQANAVTRLFQVWCKQKAHRKVIEMMARWEASKDIARGLRYWLPLVGFPFHTLVITAAAETGSAQRVFQMYSYATAQPLPEQKLSVLRYISGAVLYYASTQTEHQDSAIQIWEELVVSPREFLTRHSVGWKALRTLCQALSEKATAMEGEIEKALAARYEQKLESLTQTIGHDGESLRRANHDIRVVLARVRHLRGDTCTAHTIIQNRLRDTLEESTSIGNRSLQIAASLAAIDNDDGALAALQAVPKHHRIMCSRGNHAILAEAEDFNMVKSSFGHLLCLKCYRYLEKGELDVFEFGSNPTVLRIPCPRLSRAQYGPRVEMVVEGMPMSRETWLDKLRAEWDLRPEQIEAQRRVKAMEFEAATLIVRIVTKWRKAVLKKRRMEG
ncbi:hypothetical protein PRZ48_011075 [Zasmidium cellare]|uniref:Uncharacterized protein n=1 Tax=Zasmidium cellare TaxID=395010 RepID=A0ABR0EAF7_ZASCE|nr:hypothetical protein PRZ48_011075 [Zasmidium cellare]